MALKYSIRTAAVEGVMYQVQTIRDEDTRQKCQNMDLIPKWPPVTDSFLCMLISPLCLVIMYKKQKNFQVKMRLRGLINMQTKE